MRVSCVCENCVCLIMHAIAGAYVYECVCVFVCVCVCVCCLRSFVFGVNTEEVA